MQKQITKFKLFLKFKNKTVGFVSNFKIGVVAQC